jgi:hypothetical protein
VDYQHRICSFATLITFLAIILSIILPIVCILQTKAQDDYFIVYEQPVVKFTYKYIIIAENSMINDESKTILCSSFDILNSSNDTISCPKLVVKEKDLNFDGIADEIWISAHLSTMHNYGIKSITAILFFDARLNAQCELKVPTSIILNKKITGNFNNRIFEFNGNLKPVQSSAIICPFFLRKSKTHFFYENIDENQTEIEEFDLPHIRNRFEMNPLFISYDETSLDLNRIEETKTMINFKVKIPVISVYYKKSFWQKLLFDFWVSFIALFVISFAIINFILSHLFENRYINARRKNYIKDKDF